MIQYIFKGEQFDFESVENSICIYVIKIVGKEVEI